MSFCKISQSLEATRFVFRMAQSLWNLASAPRQHCCRYVCQISKRCDYLNSQSRGFETSRDLMIRRLIGRWNRAQVIAAKFLWVQSVDTLLKQNTTKYKQPALVAVVTGQYNIYGLVQERRNPNALAMELRFSCTSPSISSQTNN